MVLISDAAWRMRTLKAKLRISLVSPPKALATAARKWQRPRRQADDRTAVAVCLRPPVVSYNIAHLFAKFVETQRYCMNSLAETTKYVVLMGSSRFLPGTALFAALPEARRQSRADPRAEIRPC